MERQYAAKLAAGKRDQVAAALARRGFSHAVIREVLDKYCAFMPTPIMLNVLGETEEVEVEVEQEEVELPDNDEKEGV